MERGKQIEFRMRETYNVAVTLTEKIVFESLKRRKWLPEGVVIKGGEPTL